MFDIETQEAIAKSKMKDLDSSIELGMDLRKQAKELETQANDLKKAANELLDPIFSTLKVEKIVHEELGQIQIVVKSRTSYDIDEVKKYLIGHGVSPVVTKNACEAGTRTSVSRYIEYRAAKKKK